MSCTVNFYDARNITIKVCTREYGMGALFVLGIDLKCSYTGHLTMLFYVVSHFIIIWKY